MKIYQIGFQMKKNNKNHNKIHLILVILFKEQFHFKKIQKEYMNNMVLQKVTQKLLVVILMVVMKISQISKIWILLNQMLIQKKRHKSINLKQIQYLNKIVLYHQLSTQVIILIIQKRILRICQRALKKTLRMILMKALRNNLVLTMNRI